MFFCKKHAMRSGLNSHNLNFLPVPNFEDGELDAVVGGVLGALPIG